MRRRSLGVVAAALAAVLLAGCGSSTSSPGAAPLAAGSPTAVAPSNAPTGKALAPPTATTALTVVQLSALPSEAVATLQLIKDGGPYPYPNDGIMFQNREKRLPKQPAGFYQEYTVPTPGSSDRGARRIVAGSDGSRFWTQDHYASFREVIAPWD